MARLFRLFGCPWIWPAGLVLCLVFPALSSPARAQSQRSVALTMGSWRTEDIKQMNDILDKFHEEHPNVIVRFDPTPAPEYDAALAAQLEGESAPDLFYLRSFSQSRKLFDHGYLEPLTDLAGLRENFEPAMLAPWMKEDGTVYGLPFIATSHGVYYNQDLFKKLNAEVPQTWEDFLALCAKIKQAGFIPLANASGDTWTINEIVFFNLVPNFIGGREGRLAYLRGERCFNDDHLVAAFQALSDLAPFLPENQRLLKYTDSQQLFLRGKAAMWLGGSWDIPFFESEKPAFSWSLFAPPPPAGRPPFITFHLDAGMGLNAASPEKEAARTFLEWMTRPEFGGLMADKLPGFFPMHTHPPKLENPHANTFLALNRGRGTDVRLAWEKLRDGEPDGYNLMMDLSVAVINRTKQPREAADALRDGLAKWYEPAKNCGK